MTAETLIYNVAWGTQRLHAVSISLVTSPLTPVLYNVLMRERGSQSHSPESLTVPLYACCHRALRDPVYSHPDQLQ